MAENIASVPFQRMKTIMYRSLLKSNVNTSQQVYTLLDFSTVGTKKASTHHRVSFQLHLYKYFLLFSFLVYTHAY